MSGCRKCGRVAECVAAILKRDEAVALGGVEPFDGALCRSHCEGTGTAVVEVRHDEVPYDAPPGMSIGAPACPAADAARRSHSAQKQGESASRIDTTKASRQIGS